MGVLSNGAILVLYLLKLGTIQHVYTGVDMAETYKSHGSPEGTGHFAGCIAFFLQGMRTPVNQRMSRTQKERIVMQLPTRYYFFRGHMKFSGDVHLFGFQMMSHPKRKIAFGIQNPLPQKNIPLIW